MNLISSIAHSKMPYMQSIFVKFNYIMKFLIYGENNQLNVSGTLLFTQNIVSVCACDIANFVLNYLINLNLNNESTAATANYFIGNNQLLGIR